MATKHDDRTRTLILTLERAIGMARDEEHGDVETLLEAALEQLLISPTPEDARRRALPVAGALVQ